MISYDDISKSIVYFVKESVETVIASINSKSKIAMMNVPDSISEKSDTPLVVVRIPSSQERVYRDGSSCPPTYANMVVGCIILGDTFTVVQRIKDSLMEKWRTERRIPLYRFSEKDVKGVSIGTILNKGICNIDLPGDLKFPVREIDSVTFSVRVKIS